MQLDAVGGYWDSRRAALLREIERRELEIAELEAREQAMMPMLGASADERERASYAMGVAAEARAQAAAADEARVAALLAAAAPAAAVHAMPPPPIAPPPDTSAGKRGEARVETGSDDADLVASAWQRLLEQERAAAEEAMQTLKEQHEKELQSTANFWLAKVQEAQQTARKAVNTASMQGSAQDSSVILATGGKFVPNHEDAIVSAARAGVDDSEGVSTVSAEAIETLEAELFALEADYEAISDQCEVMRETLTVANERMGQMQAELDEEVMQTEIKVQKVLAFMLAKAKADAEAAAAAAAAKRDEEIKTLQERISELEKQLEIPKTNTNK